MQFKSMLFNGHLHIHTMEYNSSVERKEILTHATKMWMNLEDIMASEINHKKINISWFYLYEIPRVIKFIGTRRKQ